MDPAAHKHVPLGTWVKLMGLIVAVCIAQQAAEGFPWRLPGLWGQFCLVLLVPLLPTLWLRYRYGLPKPGHCGGCGYDLRGLAAGSKCPECGKGGGGSGT